MTAWKCQTAQFVSLLHATAHNSVCSLGYHSGTILPFAGRFLTWQKADFIGLSGWKKDFMVYFLVSGNMNFAYK
jgi:hypothetical protein